MFSRVKIVLSAFLRRLKSPLKRLKVKQQFLADKARINTIPHPPVNTNPARLLILRLDEIGDYILFRPTLGAYRKSKRFGDYEITLCGNLAWKPIFDEYDSETVHHTIWIDKSRWNDTAYRYEHYRLLREMRFDVVINPEFSRNQLLNDLLAYAAAAAKGYAWHGQLKQGNLFLPSLSRHIYPILYIQDDPLFEAYRNQLFTTRVLDEDAVFDLRSLLHPEKAARITFFPGASKASKRWPVESFAQLAIQLKANFPAYSIALAGDRSDRDRNLDLEVLIPFEVDNFTGRTDLLDFIDLIASTALLVTNDTSALHIAAWCRVPVVVVSNGTTYWRFVQYPPSYRWVRCVFPETLQAQIDSGSAVVFKTEAASEEIRQIKPERVFEEVKRLMAMVESDRSSNSQ